MKFMRLPKKPVTIFGLSASALLLAIFGFQQVQASGAGDVSAGSDSDSEGFCTAYVSEVSNVSVVRSGDFCILSFKRTGTTVWTKPAWVSTVDYLVVAGGGGGGAHVGGGGGGGGVIEGNKEISLSTVTITVGEGGVGGDLFGAFCLNPTSGITGNERTETGNFCNDSSKQTKATFGGLSQFDDSISQGGGNGGHWNYYYPGDGGSGGGAIPRTATGTAGQGFDGGAYGGPSYSPGGGGGAGSAGATGSTTSGVSGAGGSGKSSSITGVSIFYGCGGGGGGHSANDSTPAAAGCATAGAGEKANTTPAAATANFGGGGGGGNASTGISRGGAGGSGIVIVKYSIPPNPIANTSTAVVLVDPRAESIRIPLIELTSYFSNRACLTLADSQGIIDITDADTTEYKVELTGSSGASASADNSKNLRIHGTAAQINAVFKPGGEGKSFIQIKRPTTGSNTAFNEALTLTIKADNSSSAACTSAPSSTLLTATIKPYGIDLNQKNEVSLN